jgi:hypothetical protein
MAQKKISDLSDANALTGSEVAPVVQGGVTVKTPLSAIAAYANGLLTATLASITTALGQKAPLASPALAGTPTAPTAAQGTRTDQIATTSFVAIERFSSQSAALLIDDFLFGSTESGEMGELGWSFTNGAFNLVIPEANHPGMAERASTAVSGAIASTYPGGGGVTISLRFDQIDEQVWIVKPKTADTDFDLRLGFLSDLTADPPTNGAWFEKLAADTGWHGVTRISGTQSRTADLAAWAADWFKLRIRRVDATTVAFSVNGGTETNLSANVPAGANNMVFGFQIIPRSANARSLYVDRFAMRLAPQTR